MLIQRSITVPNENEINGIGAYQGAGSQTSLNNFIKDVHTALIEVGLIEVNLPDSLDIENIPYKSIDIYAQDSDRSIDYIDIGHKYYAFSDDEQEEQPVFIKITYSVKNCSRTSGNTSVANIFYTCFKVDVYRDLNNLSSVIPQQVLGYILINTHTSALVKIENYVVVDSDILTVSYDGKNLYLNIFPQTIKCPLHYNNIAYSFRYSKKSSYISFYLYRKNNVFKFINFSKYREIDATSTSYTFPALRVNQLITNINNNSTVLSTTSTMQIPLIDIVSNINNNYENGLNPLAFKSIIYDKATNSIYPNYSLLCSYTSQVGATNVAYELDLDNNTKGKYISFSIEDNNVYIPNTKTDLLIRYE